MRPRAVNSDAAKSFDGPTHSWRFKAHRVALLATAWRTTTCDDATLHQIYPTPKKKQFYSFDFLHRVWNFLQKHTKQLQFWLLDPGWLLLVYLWRVSICPVGLHVFWFAQKCISCCTEKSNTNFVSHPNQSSNGSLIFQLQRIVFRCFTLEFFNLFKRKSKLTILVFLSSQQNCTCASVLVGRFLKYLQNCLITSATRQELWEAPIPLCTQTWRRNWLMRPLEPLIRPASFFIRAFEAGKAIQPPDCLRQKCFKQ